MSTGIVLSANPASLQAESTPVTLEYSPLPDSEGHMWFPVAIEYYAPSPTGSGYGFWNDGTSAANDPNHAQIIPEDLAYLGDEDVSYSLETYETVAPNSYILMLVEGLAQGTWNFEIVGVQDMSNIDLEMMYGEWVTIIGHELTD